MCERHQTKSEDAGGRASRRLCSNAASVALALGSLYAVPAVMAQEAVLEEILVTASKKGATSLMDTAVTASVVTGEQLEVRQVRNVEDIQFQTAGVIVDTNAGAPRVAIRGIGHDGSIMHAENGVAVYADDIILQRTQAVTAAFFDLERVDVLKGPQGTAFGRNANGGSVNYVSRRPVEGLASEAGVAGGSYGRREVYGIFNYGTADYGLRIGAEYKEDDGFAKNLTTGEDVNGRETTVIRASLSFAPADNFEGILRVGYFDEDLNGPAVVVQGAEPFSLPALFGGNPSFDPNENYEIHSDLPNRQRSEITSASLHLDWDIGGLSLRSITGYYDGDYQIQNDADHSDVPFVPIPHNDFQSEQFSQEFVLSGTAGALDWLAGGYYLTEDVSQRVDIDFLLPLSPGGLSVNLNDAQELTSWAGFAQATWNVSDTTRFTAGLRYTEDEKKIDYDQEIVFGPLSPLAGLTIPSCLTSFSVTWDDVTWDLTLEHDLSDDTFAYAKVNTGFKAGGYNNTNCDVGYDPEQLLAYEVGYKGTFRDGSLTFAASAFYYEYEDIQVTQVQAFPGIAATTAVVANAAEAEVYGFEIELRALLTENVSADVGVSWVPTAEYQEFITVDALDLRSVDQNPATTPPSLDLSGNRLNRAPKFSGVIGLNYTGDLGSNWDVNARLEYYFVDDLAFSPFDRPNAFNAAIFPGLVEDASIQDGYGLLNAYVSFDYGESWTVRLYGRNLTDEYYFIGKIDNSGPQHVHGDFGRPREGGVQLVYRFSGN